MIKIYLTDDHAILLDGMEAMLRQHPELQVVGKTADPTKALSEIKKSLPDVVITDISMGAFSGLDLTRQIKTQFPTMHVVVLSMHDEFTKMDAMLKAGASGYLLKNVTNQELLTALRSVMKNEIYIQHSIAGTYRQLAAEEMQAVKKSKLSPREIEIIRLMAKEYSTAQISRELFISELTVETHRKNIWRKSGAKSIISLLQFAKEQGIL